MTAQEVWGLEAEGARARVRQAKRMHSPARSQEGRTAPAEPVAAATALGGADTEAVVARARAKMARVEAVEMGRAGMAMEADGQVGVAMVPAGVGWVAARDSVAEG